VSIRLFLTTVGLAMAVATTSAQTDLDALMSRVLQRRDDNWRKLQQYMLDERETFQLIGPGGAPLYGFRREYLWFPRDGRFIKSPVSSDGVTIDEPSRRREEERWLQREERREKRRAGGEESSSAARQAGTSPSSDAGDPPEPAATLNESSMREALEPGFVSAAYFLKFKFDPGRYALVGREQYEGRDVLRIEYYPTKLFSEGRSRPNRRARDRDPQVQQKMNKVALVTLWVDPTEHQILRYEIRNMELDFLPGRSMVRIDGVNATMEMGEPFAGVWLPRTIRVGFDLSLAIGEVDGRYQTDFHDYRLATVTTRVR
jgi:hypothetical protein